MRPDPSSRGVQWSTPCWRLPKGWAVSKSWICARFRLGDEQSALESVKKTGKCLIVHEDTITGGFAGGIMATVSSDTFEWLDAPPQRLAAPDSPIPYNIEMKNEVAPSALSIREQMEFLLAY